MSAQGEDHREQGADLCALRLRATGADIGEQTGLSDRPLRRDVGVDSRLGKSRSDERDGGQQAAEKLHLELKMRMSLVSAQCSLL